VHQKQKLDSGMQLVWDVRIELSAMGESITHGEKNGVKEHRVAGHSNTSIHKDRQIVEGELGTT
jgi:hypothetical protein